MTSNTQNTAYTATSKSMALPQNVAMGHYRLLRLLGQGGFGITYLAIDQRTNEQVVIKENMPTFYATRNEATLHIQPLDVEDAVQNYTHTLRCFVEEARTLSHLRHPNIVRVYEAFEALGTAYYVMPYIRGKELHKVMPPAAVSEAWLQPILVALLSALDYLHSYNLLHRDLEPGNILLREDGTPILIEFGTARALQTERSAPIVGTPAYSPPEQISPYGKCGPWTDIYALGATCYRIITGECPPQAIHERMFDVDPYRPLASRPELLGRFSPALLSSIDTALAVSYKNRWQSARQWLEALHSPQAPSHPATDGKSSRLPLVLGLLTLLLGGAGYGIYAYQAALQEECARAEYELAETLRLARAEEELMKLENAERQEREAHEDRSHKDACEQYIRAVLSAHIKSGLPAKKDIPKPEGKQILQTLRSLADKGDHAAKFAYSVLLMHGIRVEANKTKALQYLRAAAEGGHPTAQTTLGRRYATGAAVPRDAAEAATWFRRAAEQGHAGAQNNLGACYANGDGVSKDAEEATEWFRKAAVQGLPVAQYNLGWCYKHAHGTTEDAESAVKWFRKAADQGLADAQYGLGLCYHQGYGVGKDAEEAAKWFRKAAEQGMPDAQCNLGWCCYHGSGVSSDAAEAVKWFRKAAEQEYAAAQFYLGLCYHKGTGISKDADAAVKWFRKAADQGDALARFYMGISYQNGSGVSKNEAEAVNWYRRAAEQGLTIAQCFLGICYRNGTGVSRDLYEAVRWLRLAAEQGEPSAQYSLGVCYYNGEGVAKDYSEAIMWYRKAAQQGHTMAQSTLQNLRESW